MQLSATLPAHFAADLHRVGRAVVDGVLPPRCLACGVTVDEPDALCGRCWDAMTFFAAPWCAVCGLPFPHPMGGGGGLRRLRPRARRSWDRARAVLRYDKHSRAPGAGAEARRPDPSRALRSARWMRRAGERDARRRRSAGAGAAALDPAVRAPLQPGGAAGACDPMPPAGRRSRRTGWCAAAARRRRAVSGRWRARATCAAPSRCAQGRSVAGKRVVIIDDVHDDRRDRRGMRPRAAPRRGRLGRRADPGPRRARRR